MTRTREGDQVLPSKGKEEVSPHILKHLVLMEDWRPQELLDAIREDFTARIALGISRYGHPLETFNGRDALLDCYQELLDAAHYLMQVRLEIGPEHMNYGKVYLTYMMVIDNVLSVKELIMLREKK